MATSEPDPLPCAEQQIGAAAEHLPDGPTRMAAAHGLMAAGCTLTIPRLEGIPTEYRLLDGIEVAAKLAKTLISTGLAEPARWNEVGRDPFRFIEQALKDLNPA
jgi:hypothetical protein